MSKLEITPGPWRYNVATDGKIVAPQERGPDVVVVDADAANPVDSRFLAASTRVYDSLKALLDALDDNGSCQYEALREEGRDALAKSRGEL